MIAVFAGLGALGWTALPRHHPGRRAWTATGALAVLAIAVFFPLQQVDRLDALKTDIAARDRVQADLRELVERPAVKQALRACSRVYVPSHRPVPLIALWADVPEKRIVAPGGKATGCVVVPATEEVARLAVLDPNEPGTARSVVIAGATAQNRSWQFARDA